MSYQNLTETRGKPDLIATIDGQSLLGHAVSAPLALYEKVYILPLLTIKMNKGTGVVTSVPSDAPDDYAGMSTIIFQLLHTNHSIHSPYYTST